MFRSNETLVHVIPVEERNHLRKKVEKRFLNPNIFLRNIFL